MFGFSLTVALGLVFNLLLVYFFLERELAGELYKIHLTVRSTSEIVLPVFWKVSVATIPLGIAAFGLVGYYLTRHIEISLTSFAENLRRLKQADFSKRPAREQIEDLGEAYNKAFRSIEKAMHSLKGRVSGIELGARRLGELSSAMEGAEARKRHKEAATLKAELLNALDLMSGERLRMRQETARFKV